MLPIAVTALAWVVTSYIIYLFAASYLTARHNARRALELKCEAPPFRKNRWPLGIDQIRGALAADKEKQFPVWLVRNTENNGITHGYSIFGQKQISTADEKNVQAILANQFSDFGIFLLPPSMLSLYYFTTLEYTFLPFLELLWCWANQYI